MAALMKVDWSVFGKCLDGCGAEESRMCRTDDDERADAPCKGRPVMPAAVSRQVRDISAAEVRAEKKRVRSEARLSRNDAKQAARNAASKLAARPALVVEDGVVRASTAFAEPTRATVRREVMQIDGDVFVWPPLDARTVPWDLADDKALDRIAEVLRRHHSGFRTSAATINDISHIIRQTGRTT